MIKEFKISSLEYIQIFILSSSRCQPQGVDTKEWAKLLFEIILLDICAGCRRYPELLRIICELEIHESK
jgi:hypothetical protein